MSGNGHDADTFAVTFAGKPYVLPALNLGQVYRITPRIMSLQVLKSGSIDEAAIEPIFEALDIAREGTDLAVGYFKTVRGDIVDLFAAAKTLAEACGISRLGEAAAATMISGPLAHPSAASPPADQ